MSNVDDLLTEGQVDVEAVFRDVFGSDRPRAGHASTGTIPTFPDDEIIDRAMRATNGPKFRALWSGDDSRYGSRSEADAALVALIAFWTPDEAQIERIARGSQLARPKWDERRGNKNYLAYTISNINRQQSDRYSPKPINNNSATLKKEVVAERITGGWNERPQPR